MSGMKPIPVPPQKRLIAAIESRRKHPLYPSVVSSIEAQDLLILAEVITDRKSLNWIIEALNTPETEIVQKSKMIDTACKVFDGVVKAIEAENRAMDALSEIETAKRFAIEALAWAEAGWQFPREMRGINPATLIEHLGFDERLVTLSYGVPQWGVISLYDVAYRVVSDETVLRNRAFRRAALSSFAYFFRDAFGQIDEKDKNGDLLEWADEILTLLYGADANLAVRQSTATPSKATAKTKAAKKPASKVKAQQRGKAHADQKAKDPTRKRGYETS